MEETINVGCSKNVPSVPSFKKEETDSRLVPLTGNQSIIQIVLKKKTNLIEFPEFVVRSFLLVIHSLTHSLSLSRGTKRQQHTI